MQRHSIWNLTTATPEARPDPETLMNTTPHDMMVTRQAVSDLAASGLCFLALAALRLGGGAWRKRLLAPLEGFCLPCGS